jgi:hypothetical protein
MPVQYRDFVTNMQKNDNPQYRDQRRNPKVIVPESFHSDGYAEHLKTPHCLIQPSNSAFAMRNMPR